MTSHLLRWFIALCLSFPIASTGQTLWEDTQQAESEMESIFLEAIPDAYRFMALNTASLEMLLKQQSSESTCIEIPLPGGGFNCFEFEESLIMHPDLAAKYPHLKTYSGKSIENPMMNIRFVWTGEQFHAMAYSDEGVFFVDEVKVEGKAFYISYFDKDLPKTPQTCETHEHPEFSLDNPIDPKNNNTNTPTIFPEFSSMASPHAVGAELRTYRFAISLAGEVTVSKGGVSAAMTWLTTRMSDLNLLFERELCVHLDLIANNDTLIFPDPATDPYSGSNWLGEARTLIPAMMGSGNYDIGHLIKPTGGGVAYVGVVCNNSYKSGGTSSTSLHTHAHELGHQMAAGHTFNSCGQYGGGDFEPGSGNTLMSYDGLCGSENMPGGGYYQYHSSSFSEMVNHLFFSGGSSCAATSVTGNTPPVITVPSGGFTIPILTPFTLVGSATDDGGTSALTYSWEQYDHGGVQTPPQNPSGTAPIFQTLPYTSDSNRTIPKLSKILAGTTDIGEVMPTYSRVLNFRLMVHDNNAGAGGSDYGELQFNVDEDAGPFLVEVPNDNSTIWSEGQTRTVEWDVANTDAAPVSCATVNIIASFDGGLTFTDTLANGVANDGSHDITVPHLVGTQTRIKIEAADNIFFDISDEDFEIVSASTNDFSFNVSPTSHPVCSETSVDYQVNTQALGVFNSTIDLTISGLPAGATSNFPMNVAATSSSTITISNLSSVAVGHYTLTITATENGGGVSHQQDVSLIVQGTLGGIPGSSMSFDGNDHISVPQIGQEYQFGKTQSFTVECWIKTTTNSSDDAIFSNADWDSSSNPGWTISIETGRIGFNVADGSNKTRLRTSTTYNDGEWHHIAGTFDRSASTSQLYIDGELVLETGIGSIGDISNNLIIGIGAAAENDWDYTGEIDEARVWRKALTATEIRENMHRTIDSCEPNLISCWQFNEASGDVLDVVGQYNGTVSGATRINSTAPFGSGTANTQTESNGLVTFTGTDYSANYVTQDGATVTATKINLTPHGTIGIDPADAPLDNQYWVINRYENNGSFSAEMTFGVDEDILASDEANPAGMVLYYRAFNSDGAWTNFANGFSASDANNTVTFTNIPNYGQYLIARSGGAIIGLYTSQLDFCLTGIGQSSEVLSYEVSGVNLTNDIVISVTGNFEISLDSLMNYGNNLTLNPSGGNVAITKIFVQTIPSISGTYNGQIDHTSTNASTKSITLNGEGIAAAFDIAGEAGNFDGDNDYFTISSLSWQPTTFTVEFWLKPFSFSNWNQRIGSGWGSFLFHANSDASFWTGINTGSNRIQSPVGALKANQWSHVAVTFDNGTLTVYHNGKIVGTLNNVQNPGNWQGAFRIGDTDDDAIDGHLDEFRIWNTARTDKQIKENMHLTMDIEQGCNEGLICYYQFKDNGDGTVTDAMGTHNSTMQGNASFIASNVPAAEGKGVRKNVTAVQNYSFHNADFDTNVDINYTGTLPGNNVGLFEITGEGSHGPLPNYDVLISNYWIANNYGDTTALGDITFSLMEDITTSDENNPQYFQIYGRSPNAFGAWTLLAGASAASDANNTLTFTQIKTQGQFLLVKTTTPTISLSGGLTDFGIRVTNVPTETQFYTISAKALTNDITVVAPSGFEVSLNSNNGFASSISVSPTNGIITNVPIYVRFLPTTEQVYSGHITHNSPGATEKVIAVTGEGKNIGIKASNALSGSGGQYLSIPQTGDLAFGTTQDFTVELWIYTDANNSDPSIISNKNWNSGGNDGWGLFYLANDWKVNIDGVGGSRVDLNSNAPDLNDGKWHHIAAVFDRDGLLSIYQDGWLTASTSLAGVNDKVITTNYPINVLQDGTGTYNDLMDAKIDELRIWTAARTTQEIRENMHLTLQGTESNLAAYYQFNESTGDCLDLIGGHHGTLVNGATRVNSEVNAAGGISATHDIQTAQNYSFHNGGSDTNLDITFSGTLPLGEVVVSNLTGEAPHGTPPTTDSLTSSYWIVNNFGTNTTGLTADLNFQTPNNWVSYSDTASYQLHKRASNALPNNGWNYPQNANVADTNNDQLTFNGIDGFSQFIVSRKFAPTCYDGVQNGDETNIDCGGSCDACGNCTYSTINSNDFEPGWGIWVDGGSNARRDAADAPYAFSGSYCVRLRDDTETSRITTGDIDLSNHDEVMVTFAYLASSMDDPSEDFWLQISTDGGSTFNTVEEWNQGDEFENDFFYQGFAVINGPFSATTQFRFQCDASGTSDWVYLDDIVIKGCGFTCNDGFQNGDETGVDCGGSNCPACPTCSDGIQNGDETGIDCGGSCSPCNSTISCVGIASPNTPVNGGSELIAVEDTLSSTAQITSMANVQYYAGNEIYLKPGFQSDNGTQFLAKIQSCISTCYDGLQNGDETGVDCGGNSCPSCSGPTCSDGIQNGDETGIDCGGTYCGACAAPSCSDGIQNGDETGIDCGGSCPACSAPCLVMQVLNDTIISGSHLFNVTDTLTSTDSLSGTAVVDYRAGKSIFLLPGFSGSSGIQFVAKIMTCSPTPLLEEEVEAILTQFDTNIADGTEKNVSLKRPAHILVYPNPTRDQLQIQIKTERLQKVEFSIQNSLGRILHFEKTSLSQESSSYSVDVSAFPPGMYWLRIRFVEDGDWQVVQFVKS